MRAHAILALLLLPALAGCAVEADVAPPIVGLPPRWSAASATLASGTYVFGGYDGTDWKDDVFRIDPVTQLAERIGALPRPLAAAAAVAVGDRILILGGNTNGHQALDQVLAYDPANARFETLPPLPSPRAHVMAAFDGIAVYVFGGESMNNALAEIVRIDPLTGARETLATHLPGPRQRGCAAFDGDDTIYLVGGYAGDATTLAFDTRNHHVRPTLGQLPGWGGVACAADHLHVYSFGGIDHERVHQTDIWRMTIATAEVARHATELIPGRSGATASTWEGVVIIVGGATAVGGTGDILAFDDVVGAGAI